jgi:hypothetical protein
MLDCGSDLLQRDPDVEQPLDDLQHQDVAEAVQPLRARAAVGAHARLAQACACPVVTLLVGDTGSSVSGWSEVADLFGRDLLGFGLGRRCVIVE